MRYMYVTQNGFIDPPPQIAFNMDQIFILDHFLKNKELIFSEWSSNKRWSDLQARSEGKIQNADF